MTAPAGYIHDQRCPTHPHHGNADALENGMFCPHSEHTSPKTGITKSYWTFTEWEAAKTGEQPKSTPVPTGRARVAIALKTRKTNGKANRRRSR